MINFLLTYSFNNFTSYTTYLQTNDVRVRFFDLSQNPGRSVLETQMTMFNVLEIKILRVAVSENIIGENF